MWRPLKSRTFAVLKKDPQINFEGVGLGRGLFLEKGKSAEETRNEFYNLLFSSDYVGDCEIKYVARNYK